MEPEAAGGPGPEVQALARPGTAGRMRAQPMLIVVSAPSGAGKTSLCEWVVGALPGLAHSVSYTTRPPRPHEADGRDYCFVEESRFRTMAAQGQFVEWAEVHGHLYGTARTVLERHFREGRDVILDIDTRGAAILRGSHPDGVFVFIAPPSWRLLEERLRQRNSDAEDEIQRRLQRAREEVRHYVEYQYVIVNDMFARAAEALKAIIVAERLRGSRADLGFLGL